MRVSRIEIKNFIGIKELKLDLGKINIITGRKGEGKTSIIQSIQKGVTNQNERVEVIRHGEEEETFFTQPNTGFETNRKTRTNKTNYLKSENPVKRSQVQRNILSSLS